MQSLDESFQELRLKIKQGRELNFVSFEPIYYLVFDPSQILEVKRKLRSWKATLAKKDHFKVEEFSIGENIHKVVQNHDEKEDWVAHEKHAGYVASEYSNTIKEVILEDGELVEKIKKKLHKLSQHSNGLLLVTDLEALHSFLRIGQIEAELMGQFNIPTVFLYPGTRTGKTGLKFLGFYPDDGSYRSVHVGG
jgi:hypothetical protein